MANRKRLLGIALLVSILSVGVLVGGTGCQPKTIRMDVLLEEESLVSLTKKAQTIVIGVVEEQLPSQESRDQLTGEPIIYSDWVIAVEECLKSPLAGDRIIVRTLGGTVGQMTMIVDSAPSFAVGERVLLFLSKQTGQYFDLPENHYTVQGWVQGKYTISGMDAFSAASDRSEPLDKLLEQITAAEE